jgi:hypothetical protein
VTRGPLLEEVRDARASHLSPGGGRGPRGRRYRRPWMPGLPAPRTPSSRPNLARGDRLCRSGWSSPYMRSEGLRNLLPRPRRGGGMT